MLTPSSIASLALLATLAPRGAEDPEIHWKGGSFRLNQPPDEVGENARSAAREWAAWAAKFGYRLDLDARAGLLLITPAGTGAIERRLQVIDSVEAWFEKLLPR